MSPRDVLQLRERLTDRDLGILASLRTHRLATTSQLRRLHFTEGFTTVGVATRATQRVLGRLESHGLTARLRQRVGGARRGTDSTMWQLASTGDRLLSVMNGEDKRSRYIEPGLTFARHSVEVTDLAVQLLEAVRRGELDDATVTTEPANWRHFLGAHARPEILKPDLYAVTASGEFLDYWWLERDLGTEHPPVVARKAQVYERYAATGSHQAEHDVLPAVLWVVDNPGRQVALERALRHDKRLTPGMHRVVTAEAFLPTVLLGNELPP